MLELCWHGGASVSLRVGSAGGRGLRGRLEGSLGGGRGLGTGLKTEPAPATPKLEPLELVVDPAFSKAGDYGPWFVPNPHAPSVPEYLRFHDPDYVLITHGHFDHFDLETVKKLAASTRALFAGSADVCSTLQAVLGVPESRTVLMQAGRTVLLGGGKKAVVEVTPVEGEHWVTGDEGRAVAAKFAARPDRYGVMPCGGPMLGYIAGADGHTVFFSGDTHLSAIPKRKVDVAVLSVGGLLADPRTRELTKEILDEAEAARAAGEFLAANVLVPVHWDHDVFPEKPRVSVIASHLERASRMHSKVPKLVVPPYGEWVEVA